jgi:dTDP-4-amino-4,6-dideoxygalactose transaminase
MTTSGGMPVPLFDLKLQYRGLFKPMEEAVNRVLASGCYIGGPEVAALEKEVADYCGAAAAVGCASGTDALYLALAALDIGPGDEVIVPAFSFFASASAVCRVGARPVFCDIDPATFNLDPHQVENKITPRTRAVMPVHLFGQCVDMEPLWQIAERHKLLIVEDAAQAIGSEYQGKRTGTLGAVACFSFYPTKSLGAYGEGGMVVTNDRAWAAKMACLRSHGMEPRYYHKYIGWNCRLDALQAAVLRVKLAWLNRFLDSRQAIARRYDQLIDEQQLGGFLQKPVVRTGLRHTFNQYVVRVKDGRRDPLAQHFRADGIGYEIYYPVPLHLQEAFAFLGHGPGDFPASEQACREVIALPMFPELVYEQQIRVIQSCAAFLRQRVRLAA